jgi:hypothetical protein
LNVRRGHAHRQDSRVVVSAKIDEAFAFLVDPRNMRVLDPPWTDFRFVSGPAMEFGLGSEREHTFRWSGIPVYLRIRVTAFEPPTLLVLDQVVGPWQSYRLALTFQRVPGGTEITEQEDVRAMPGFLDHLVHRLFVVRQLRAIAAFRREALLTHLGAGLSFVEATRPAVHG